MKAITLALITGLIVGCSDTDVETHREIKIENLGVNQLGFKAVLHRLKAQTGPDSAAIIRTEITNNDTNAHSVQDQLFYSSSGEITAYLAIIPQHRWKVIDDKTFTKNPSLKQWTIQLGDVDAILPSATVTSSALLDDSYTMYFTTSEDWTSSNNTRAKDITLKFSMEIISLPEAQERYENVKHKGDEWNYTVFRK